MQKFVYFLGFCLLLIVNVCNAVKIKKLTVPSYYELNEESGHIILDCDYEYDANESGFVLKWLHNNVLFYQWIPKSRPPFVVGSQFKDRIDLNYVGSQDPTMKHRAVKIIKPLLIDSGNYTCSVGSLRSDDKQTAELKIVDPVDSINITYNFNSENDTVKFECNILGVYPVPDVKLIIDDVERKDIQVNSKDTGSGIYDVDVFTQLKRDDVKDDSDVVCEVNIPNSEYKSSETITYDDPKLATTTKNAILGELTISKNPQSNHTNENAGTSLSSCLLLISSTTILMLLSRQ